MTIFFGVCNVHGLIGYCLTVVEIQGETVTYGDQGREEGLPFGNLIRG